MEFYNLVREPEEVKKFLKFLPEHLKNECLTVALFFRKKYVRDNPEYSHLSLSNDDGCWDRTIVSSTLRDKETDFLAKVFRSILRYNCPIGAYVDRKEQPIPEGAISLYMSINPRCAIKGAKELMNELTRDCFLPSSSETPFVGNLVSRAKTKVQKNVSRKLIADIDIDVKDETILNRFRDLVSLWDSEVCAIETRGGYHVLCDIQKMSRENPKWFVDIKKYADEFRDKDGKELVEFKTDTLSPIPGTLQGNHLVKLI